MKKLENIALIAIPIIMMIGGVYNNAPTWYFLLIASGLMLLIINIVKEK